ncbi:MAG TPA: hypothetical protein VH475_20250 [Tepidisphaeraceae bacterium]
MSDDPVQLEYAPARPARRWRFRRWLLAAMVLLAVWAGAEWVPSAVERLRLLRVQDRCATFDFPPDVVIFDSDPARRAALLADARNYVALDDTSVWPTQAVARREPDCWTSLKQIVFGTRQFWPPGPGAPKALVHRLRNGRGQERLVAVIVAPSTPGRAALAAPSRLIPRVELGLVAALIQPATDWDAPPRWDGNGTFFKVNIQAGQRLRIYAGHVDPNDPSRFMIGYEMDGQPGTIDGRFQDDGDVTLTVRDGPATLSGAIN